MTYSRHNLDRGRDSALPVVRPSVVLAATVFGGVWLGWPWYVFNAFALGVEDKARLTKRIAVGLLGATVLSLLVLAVAGPEQVDASALGLLFDDPEREFSWVPYVALVLVGWKLTISYLLFEDQRASAEIYEYYGGTLRNGIPLVAAGSLLRGWVLFELLPLGWWTLVLA